MQQIVEPGNFNNLSEFIEKCCMVFSNRIAFIEGESQISYQSFWESAVAFSAFLAADCGVGLGNRVAIMLPNVIEFPLGSLAILATGATQVNVNPFYTARELRHQLNDAEASVIITNFASLRALAEADPPSLKVVVVTDCTTEQASELLPSRLQIFEFDKGLRLERNHKASVIPPNRQSLAFLQYTGGTTGLSKGAMLSHGNILANIGQFQAMLVAGLAQKELTALTAIPLYHIFALNLNLFSMMAIGASNVLIANPRDLDYLTEQWGRHRVNFVTGVNTLFKGLCSHPGFAAQNFASDLTAIGGGAPVQRVVSERWKKLTGRHIREGYGLSETSPILTCTPLNEERFLSSIGIAVPNTHISIRDANGQEVPQGEIGELCARGPQVMQGYWRRPEATAAVMTQDGYFRTGDMARRDSEGHFYIVDRQKDMILVSGFNVYPNEVEATVAELPGVTECACVGQQDADTGEGVAIYIVRNDEALSVEQVREHCRRNLAAYKVPRYVHFISEMPKSSVGKILRRSLRADCGNEVESTG